LNQVEALLKRFGAHSAVIGFEPVNEPWWNSDINILKDFYRSVRKMV
jgi:aryl-phospho-beta-D-glucosidase BglC (GH1 family)